MENAIEKSASTIPTFERQYLFYQWIVRAVFIHRKAIELVYLYIFVTTLFLNLIFLFIESETLSLSYIFVLLIASLRYIYENVILNEIQTTN